MTVHVKLSVLLLPLFLVGPLAMAEGIRRVSEVYRWMFYAAGVLWTVSAVAFWFSPTEIDGMVERIAGSVTLLWTVPLGLYFLHRGRRRMSR